MRNEKESNTFAGVMVLAVTVLTGCSSCGVESEAVSSEVVETPSQIEVVETSEEISEVVVEVESEVIEDEVTEMPDLLLRDENGAIYNPGEISEEEVYAAIDRLVAENDLSDYDRDFAIAAMLVVNGPYLSEKTFLDVTEDYLANFEDASIIKAWEKYVYYHSNTMVDYQYLIIDEKQRDLFEEAEKYRKSGSYVEEDYYNQIIDSYIAHDNETQGYDVVLHILGVRVANNRVDLVAEKYEDMSIINPFKPGYELILKNGSFKFQLGRFSNKDDYVSSHQE